MSKEITKQSLAGTIRSGDKRVLRLIAESYRTYRELGGGQDYGDFRKDGMDILAEAIEAIETREEDE